LRATAKYLRRDAGLASMHSARFLAVLLALTSCTASAELPVAPPLTATRADAWINSPPLSWPGLRGKVVLLEFWTFGCSNCRNTLPWLKAVDTKYRNQGLVIIGVHTPEFAHERVPANVQQAVRDLGIRYPVMLDPAFEYWKRLNNRYWPAFYLIDRHGRIVATAIGELHAGEPRGDRFEAQLRAELMAPR
jgi:thiol-disulfide isomerase/thioredoxin